MKKCILINSPIFWDAAAEGENYLSPLGLGYIATYVEKAGIQVEILDAVKQRKSVEDIVKYIEEKQPDYVGINIFTQNYKLVKAICEQTKVKCEWFIGGLVVGSIYEEIVKWNLKNRMNIIIGDGEYIIPTIILDNKKVEPIKKIENIKVFRVNAESEFFPRDISDIVLNRKFFHDEIIKNHYGEREIAMVTSRLTQKRSLTIFFDGFTWLVQIVMFLTLGLLVNLDELLQPDVLMLGCLVGAFMMFIARPVTVFACMAPFRKFTTKARLYVSWVGLRGAVPIIFATYPLLAGTEGARLLFNVVFLVTILSLLVQGTTVSWMANLLGLGYAEKSPAFGVDVHEDIPSIFTEVLVNESMLQGGATLKEINLPENTLVMMVYRDGDYFVPQGNTELKVGDKLLVISDRGEELESTYKDMGVDEVLKL